MASWIVSEAISKGRPVSLEAPHAEAGEQGIFVLRPLARPSATYRAFAAALKHEIAKMDGMKRAASLRS